MEVSAAATSPPVQRFGGGDHKAEAARLLKHFFGKTFEIVGHGETPALVCSRDPLTPTLSPGGEGEKLRLFP